MLSGEIFIGLGANLGMPKKTFDATLVHLEATACRIRKKSSLYRSQPYGFKDQPDFLNSVVEIETSLSPLDLLKKLQNIEEILGKTTIRENGPRLIDLDLLLYRDTILDKESLKLPHPGIAERDFVLLPLAEIAPDFLHPVNHHSMKTLLRNVDKTHHKGKPLPWD
jgi:2-amino-4-hydroxy-6-hydroxymethyldihydropteridine diphosphokinase